MQFSLFFFADNGTSPDAKSGGRYRLLLESARFADTHDFSAVWTPERHFHSFGGLYPNPSVTSAAVAAVTERVGIRAGSVVSPVQDPLRVAEEWSVVDNISHGRAAVSFGSGWHPNDFVLKPDQYQQRREHVLTTLDAVRRLWRGESLPRVNGLGDEIQVRVYPPPVQPELPVWLTSAGSVETFVAAGKAGAGLLTHLVKQGPELLATNIAEYRKAFSPTGSGIAAPGHVTLMLHTFVGDSDEAVEQARAPMREYVSSSLSLFETGKAETRSTRRPVPAKIQERLLEQSVERYLQSGLVGSVERVIKNAQEMRDIGVDEIACLIDFGLPVDTVLQGLPYLNSARQALVS